MKIKRFFLGLLLGICLPTLTLAGTQESLEKKRIIVVDGYHREYLWSTYTHDGFCAAMLEFGYFDNHEQITGFTRNDYIETSKVIIKKLWMDSKRKESKKEKAAITSMIVQSIREFKPHLIFLGEDNAAQYIGNQYLDSKIPIVFWGVNNTPVKYGLVNSIDRPGHNVTGVYQTTYYVESLALLKKLVPWVKTFALLSDATTTGRIFEKTIHHLDRKGLLPLKLVETVSTNSFEEWKKKALALQKKVDAFFVAQYAGLKNEEGKAVSDEQTASWYLTHIKIPEAAGFKHRVVDGMLCAADDSGYNQGYEAVVMAHEILAKGKDPAMYPPHTPKRGPLMVNKQRAKMLGITLTENMGIEKYIEKASALKQTMEKKRFLVVSSYHREHTWTQETNRGLCEAMLSFGYFDDKDLVAHYTKNDYIMTSTSIIKKAWMDAKRKNSKAEKEQMSRKIYAMAKEFKPDLIFLGDDDAAEYIGKKFLDTTIPIIFWGLNNTPLKYGLVDDLKMPGHNVTGVYQSGYYRESLELLKTIAPGIKTFAVLADETPTGRSHYKQIQYLNRKGLLPLELIETVSTGDYDLWQKKALELQKKVDAFFVAQYSGLKDKEGNYVEPKKVAKWYITNITIPETSWEHFVRQGMLCAAHDNGYNQGYEAVVIAYDILQKGVSPATYPPRTPKRGPLMVNKQRASMLGIFLTDKMGIEEYVEKASVFGG